MMNRRKLCGFWLMTAALMGSAGAAAAPPSQALIIPEARANAPQRRITVEDMSALRRIDTLRLSPDHQRFAILVRQADASTNSYRMGWFVGSTEEGSMVPVGDGGDARLAVGYPQTTYNSIERVPVRWSTDGRWIAYTLARGGEVQLWRSRTDGSRQEQVTRNAADVREFEWSKDGKFLYFTVATPREELRAREAAKELSGYHYDTDFRLFTDLMALRVPPQGDTTVWVVKADGSRERLASETERSEYKRAQELGGGGFQPLVAQSSGPFATRGDGMQARARLEANSRRISRMEVSQPGSSAQPLRCAATECSGVIDRVWWGDENTVLFLRLGGREGVSLYAWNVASGAVSLVVRVEDTFLTQCDLAVKMRVVCVRETATLPPHVAFIDAGAGSMQMLADANPEFRNITLGKVERFEWDTPKFKWNEPGARLEGIFPDRAYGYVLYPPDFDPSRQYPVFINPYAALGFDNITNQEYALHAMAATGFVVLNLFFPQPEPEVDIQARLGSDYAKLLNSAELGFPHASMHMESTVRALDLVSSRGFVDERRVGIGGVSQGAFIPLYLVLKHDRIAAVSIGTGTVGQLEYYAFTQRGQKLAGTMPSWTVKPVGPGVDFWKQLDLADTVEAIEAPILINTPAQEIYTLVRLMKHMAEAGKPYDAYVFSKEPHIKWQPAHLRTCMQRNLDWFRFWLQSYEDPDQGKAEQYSRWRKLRELQEANGRPLNQQPSAARVPVPH